jgi:hypothetical protein
MMKKQRMKVIIMSEEQLKYDKPYSDLNAMEKTQVLSWLNRKIKTERQPKSLTPAQRKENARKIEAMHAIEEHQRRKAEKAESIFEGIEL